MDEKRKSRTRRGLAIRAKSANATTRSGHSFKASRTRGRPREVRDPMRKDPAVFGEPRMLRPKGRVYRDERGAKLNLVEKHARRRTQRKLRDRIRSAKSTINNRLHPSIDRKFVTRKKSHRRGSKKSSLSLEIQLNDSMFRHDRFALPEALDDVVSVKGEVSPIEEGDEDHEVTLMPVSLSPTQRRAASASAMRRSREYDRRWDLDARDSPSSEEQGRASTTPSKYQDNQPV